MFLLGTAVLLIGSTVGVLWVERHRSRQAMGRLLGVLCAVGVVTIWASHDAAWQVVMPLISMLVLFRSAPWGLLAMVVFGAEVAAIEIAEVRPSG